MEAAHHGKRLVLVVGVVMVMLGSYAAELHI